MKWREKHSLTNNNKISRKIIFFIAIFPVDLFTWIRTGSESTNLDYKIYLPWAQRVYALWWWYESDKKHKLVQE